MALPSSGRQVAIRSALLQSADLFLACPHIFRARWRHQSAIFPWRKKNEPIFKRGRFLWRPAEQKEGKQRKKGHCTWFWRYSRRNKIRNGEQKRMHEKGQKMNFWVVPAENFRKQRNIWKGSPVFPDGIFQSEIRVPFLPSLQFDTSFSPSRSFSGKSNWLNLYKW